MEHGSLDHLKDYQREIEYLKRELMQAKAEANSTAKRWQAAIAAMQGLLACPEIEGSTGQFAKWSFDYADAMLEAEGRDETT